MKKIDFLMNDCIFYEEKNIHFYNSNNRLLEKEDLNFFYYYKSQISHSFEDIKCKLEKDKKNLFDELNKDYYLSKSQSSDFFIKTKLFHFLYLTNFKLFEHYFNQIKTEQQQLIIKDFFENVNNNEDGQIINFKNNLFKEFSVNDLLEDIDIVPFLNKILNNYDFKSEYILNMHYELYKFIKNLNKEQGLEIKKSLFEITANNILKDEIKNNNILSSPINFELIVSLNRLIYNLMKEKEINDFYYNIIEKLFKNETFKNVFINTLSDNYYLEKNIDKTLFNFLRRTNGFEQFSFTNNIIKNIYILSSLNYENNNFFNQKIELFFNFFKSNISKKEFEICLKGITFFIENNDIDKNLLDKFKKIQYVKKEYDADEKKLLEIYNTLLEKKSLLLNIEINNNLIKINHFKV